jgi:hypothetical protein
MKVHARCSRQDFLRDGEHWSPLWLIENDLGKRLLMAVPMGQKDDRDAIAAMMRKAIRGFGGVRYAYALEVWFLPPVKDPSKVQVSPRNSPNRREGLLIQGEDINGEQRVVFYEIKRHGDGKPTLSKAIHSTEFAGRFSDMFAAGPYT